MKTITVEVTGAVYRDIAFSAKMLGMTVPEYVSGTLRIIAGIKDEDDE